MLRHNVIVSKNLEISQEKNGRPNLHLVPSSGPTDGSDNRPTSEEQWLREEEEQWLREELAQICECRGIENPEEQPDFFYECLNIGTSEYED